MKHKHCLHNEGNELLKTASEVEMNKLLIFLILLTSLIIVSNVNAVCVTPTESTPMNASYTMAGGNPICNGTYYLNNTVLIVNATISSSNKLVECNGTIFISNGLNTTIGLKSSGNVANFTIKGCTFINYGKGMLLNNYNSIFVINNTFINSSIYGVEWSGVVQGANIINNSFINASMFVQGNSNGVIQGNTWSGCTVYCGSSSKYNLYLFSSNYNMTIQNNLFQGTWVAMYINNNLAGRIFIYNNTFRDADIGLRLRFLNPINDNTTYIIQNQFINNTAGYDGYLLDLDIINISNVQILNNSFPLGVDDVMDIQGSSNMLIGNNTFNLLCITNRSQYASNPQNEPCSYIKIGQLYKTWNYMCNNVYTFNSTCVLATVSNNISIYQNTYSGDAMVYLYLQGATNIYNDLTGYWYRAFNFNNSDYSSTGKSEFYIKNAYDSIYNYIRNYTTLSHSYSLYEGYWNNLTYLQSYGISKTSQYFYPISAVNLNLWSNLVNYPYNDIKNTSNGVILASNVDNYSLTLSPNQQIEGGDFVSPNITSVVGTALNDTAIQVNWTTDILSDTRIKYGSTKNISSATLINNSVLVHSITINGLVGTQLYYFNVTSVKTNSTHNTTSGYYNVTTLSPPTLNITCIVYGNGTISIGCDDNYLSYDSSNNVVTIIALYNITLNLTGFTAYYPYNDLKNGTVGSITNVIASNFDNYSINLIIGQQLQIGNFTYLNFNIVYGSNVQPNRLGLRTITTTGSDPDSVFRNISYYEYDSNSALLKYNYSNSVNSSFNFTLSAFGTYYSRVIIYDNRTGTFYDSGLIAYDVRVPTMTCSNSLFNIWNAMITIMILGLIWLMWMTLTTDFTIASLVILTVVIMLITTLVSMLSGTC